MESAGVDPGLKMLGIAGPLDAEHRLAARSTAARMIDAPATSPAILSDFVLGFALFIYTRLMLLRSCFRLSANPQIPRPQSRCIPSLVHGSWISASYVLGVQR